MDPEFWHTRWNSNQIGFHQKDINAMLMGQLKALDLSPGSRIFVPLCGKSHDIVWLLSQGYSVVGAELSKLAIDQLFEELNLIPEISTIGVLLHYHAPDIDIFVGDIFNLDAEIIGQTDAVYDRAALVALPQDMRERYAQHMPWLTNTAPQLLICFEYDQSIMQGPPFSINAQEVERLYGDHYSLTPLAHADVKGGLKGVCSAIETAWHLYAL